MLEQKLQKKILDYLDAQGAWTIKTISVNKRGCPDILACYNGHFLAIEVKREGKLSTLRGIQQHQINEINKRGGIAFAADNLEKVQEVLDKL